MTTSAPKRSSGKHFFGTGLVRADRILREVGMTFTFSFETLELCVFPPTLGQATPLLFPYAQLLMMSEQTFREALGRVPDQLPTPVTETPQALTKRASTNRKGTLHA